jgi:deazaflavin-dependent oxidoreductase (nitroreductase family)
MSDWRQKLAGLRDVRTCRITTRGRKTGRPHTVTIWFVIGAEEQRVYLGTLRMGRDWPRNVAANPEVIVDIADLRLQGRARIVADDRKRQRVESALAAKYWGVWIGSWLGLRPQGVFEVDLGGESAS